MMNGGSTLASRECYCRVCIADGEWSHIKVTNPLAIQKPDVYSTSHSDQHRLQLN